MLRTQQQLDVLETQMNDAVRKQIAARQTSDDLKRKNGEILLSIANGETKIESALKQVQQNAQEAARSATESEQQRARYSAMSSQYQQMFTQLSKAQGELYQATYQAELNNQLAAVGQEAAKAQGEANVSAQKEAAVAEPKPAESVQAEPIAAPVSEQPAKQVAVPSMEQQPKQPKPVQKAEKAKPTMKKEVAQQDTPPKDATPKVKRTSPRSWPMQTAPCRSVKVLLWASMFRSPGTPAACAV
jgi:hypothetical protein